MKPRTYSEASAYAKRLHRSYKASGDRRMERAVEKAYDLADQLWKKEHEFGEIGLFDGLTKAEVLSVSIYGLMLVANVGMLALQLYRTKKGM